MKTKVTPDFTEERNFWDNGMSHVIGIDEVGVGCFAGPVVVAGVVFTSDSHNFFEDKTHELYSFFHKIKDSKMLLPKIREELSPIIQKTSIHFSICEVPVETIDILGIRKAMFYGMREVISKISQKISLDSIAVLVDGFAIPDMSHTQKHIIKGDQKCISIAAASIIAKVYRDALMEKHALDYPHYHFEKNKGYGTKDHRDAIKQHGLTDLHRSSFNLKQFC